MNRVLPATSLLLLVASVGAQAPAADLVLNGTKLGNVRATLDPSRALQLEGHAGDRRHAFRLRFPRLAFPGVGRHALSALAPQSQVRVQRATGDSYSDLLNGELEIAAFGAERVTGKLVFGVPGDETVHQLQFDVAPQLALLEPAVVKGAHEVPGFTPPVDRPASEDLVFCAVGGTGTGLPGARAVANQIAKLAETGPLDFVLLAGDNISPRGVESAADAQWRTKFEDVFDRRRLPMPFYAVCGVDDWMGNETAEVEYGVMSPRWTMPALGYSFDVESHGQTFTFIGLNTAALLGDQAIEESREALRAANKAILASEAGWKIVFGYHGIISNGRAFSNPTLALLEERIGRPLYDAGVDVYISGDGRVLELLGTRNGTLHVTSGAGGGPEMAESVAWRDDTLFAHTGGGFAWFRFDGKSLEISLRGADGEVLYAHRLSKSMPIAQPK